MINVPTERWPGILAEVVWIGKLLDRLNRDDLPDERNAALGVFLPGLAARRAATRTPETEIVVCRGSHTGMVDLHGLRPGRH